MAKLGNIFIEKDGILTNINTLDRQEYEIFLEMMQALIIAYGVIDNANKRMVKEK